MSEHPEILESSITEIEDNAKLCYVEGSWAYFTTRPLNKQWGDDWNDAPYEHNAGRPYVDQDEPGEVFKVAFESRHEMPGHQNLNSPWSVQQINAGCVAWLVPCSWDIRAHPEVRPIPAGTTLREFRNLIWQAGGSVYEEVTP